MPDGVDCADLVFKGFNQAYKWVKKYDMLSVGCGIYVWPYGTYVPVALESRLHFQSKSSVCGVAVSFVVSSCDSKFSVLDWPVQLPERHSIVKFQ